MHLMDDREEVWRGDPGAYKRRKEPSCRPIRTWGILEVGIVQGHRGGRSTSYQDQEARLIACRLQVAILGTPLSLFAPPLTHPLCSGQHYCRRSSKQRRALGRCRG
jgi:hypothetical protein